MDEIDKILSQAGIVIDGPNPWDPQVNKEKTTKEKLLSRILAGGNLAVGESYVDNEWTCADLTEMIYRVFRNSDLDNFFTINVFWSILRNKFINLQSISRSFEIAKAHYNPNQDLFDKMLGKTMSYTCGYWKNTDDFETAMEQNLELICRKLHLKPGMKVLDIGCGWGNFMKYASEKYGVKCVGISVSEEQKKVCLERCKGLPVEYIITDYRNFNPGEKFDAIVSVESIEHIGPKNYKVFFEKVSSLLKDDGLFYLQAITNKSATNALDPFIDKYIFPNGYLSSPKTIFEAMEVPGYIPKSNLICEDIQNIGHDYYKTLLAWNNNMQKAWSELVKSNGEVYDDRFKRIWEYYLLVCAGMFKARHIQLFEYVFSAKGILGGYESVR